MTELLTPTPRPFRTVARQPPVHAAAGMGQVLGVELMRTGQWELSTGPLEVTPWLIAEAVRASTDPYLRTPVIKLGHGPQPRGTPAYGQVTNLRASADGQCLLGDLVNVPAGLVARLPSSYPDRSIEGFLDTSSASGETYGIALTALALLGADAPAIPTLAALPTPQIAAAAGLLRTGRPIAATARGCSDPDLAVALAAARNLAAWPKG
jgi:hypothetical protein